MRFWHGVYFDYRILLGKASKNEQERLKSNIKLRVCVLKNLSVFILGESYLVGQFRQIKRSLAEQFRQIKCSLAEQFRQIKHSLVEQFRQIQRSLAEQFRQIKRSLAEQFRQIKCSLAEP